MSNFVVSGLAHTLLTASCQDAMLNKKGFCAMRRADRLLQIIQILRRNEGPATCADMALELEVSERTIYRDMVSLQSTGVPVRGEAGIGYVMEEGYHLPPLMFSANELEAIMLGARMVDGRVDKALTRSARDVIAKIRAVIPDHMKSALVDAPLYAPHWVEQNLHNSDIEALRGAIRSGIEVEIKYMSLGGIMSKRILWPINIGVFPETIMLTAWCTKRSDFRSFRIERIKQLQLLQTKIGVSRSVLFARWKETPGALIGDPQKRPNARISGVGPQIA